MESYTSSEATSNEAWYALGYDAKLTGPKVHLYLFDHRSTAFT